MTLSQRVISNAYASLKSKTAFRLCVGLPKLVRDGDFDIYIHTMNDTTSPKYSTPRRFKKDPLIPPYPAHTLVDHLTDGPAHYIKINKFMLQPGHVVLSSDDPNAIQGSQLNDADFAIMARMLAAFKGKGITYYNGGVLSGCSQLHKHAQYIPVDRTPLMRAYKEKVRMPYKYFAKELEGYGSSEIKRAYRELLNKAFHNHEGQYNFIVADMVALLVPRSKPIHPSGFSVNSLNFAGHFPVFKQFSKELLKSPLLSLREVGIPSDA